MNKAMLVAGAVLLMGMAVAMAEDKPAVKKQTMCPIMNEAVNTNLFVDYEGKRIYVCCKSCLKKVKTDPAAIVAQLEKEGITLDQATDTAKKGCSGCKDGKACASCASKAAAKSCPAGKPEDAAKCAGGTCPVTKPAEAAK